MSNEHRPLDHGKYALLHANGMSFRDVLEVYAEDLLASNACDYALCFTASRCVDDHEKVV